MVRRYLRPQLAGTPRLYLKCDVLRDEVSPELKYWVGIEGLFARFFAWLARRMPNERQRLLAITIVAGGLCGLAAVAFHVSCACLYALLIDRATAAPGHSWIWWTILTPALGGLVAGLGLTYWVPAAAGSGIPQVKTAYTFRFGAITMKETLGKFVLCALQLGSGASLGVEGPTVQICAGVSSFLARVARLSPKNRRRMASVGMAAGIAAAFNAPIAAVTFTLEELIGNLDQTMLSGVIVAAALAAVVEHSILGSNPIFHVPRLQIYAGQCFVAGLVCAAGIAGGDCLGGVYRFAAVAARVVQAAHKRSQVGSAGHWRRGHGEFCRGGACCSFT